MSIGERLIEKLKKQLGREPTAEEIFEASTGSGLLDDKEFDAAVEKAREEIEKDLKPGYEIRSILRDRETKSKEFEDFMRGRK